MPQKFLAEDDWEPLRSWTGVQRHAARVVLAPRRKSPKLKLQPKVARPATHH